jgi:hypothetical protein
MVDGSHQGARWDAKWGRAATVATVSAIGEQGLLAARLTDRACSPHRFAPAFQALGTGCDGNRVASG